MWPGKERERGTTDDDEDDDDDAANANVVDYDDDNDVVVDNNDEVRTNKVHPGTMQYYVSRMLSMAICAIAGRCCRQNTTIPLHLLHHTTQPMRMPNNPKTKLPLSCRARGTRTPASARYIKS